MGLHRVRHCGRGTTTSEIYHTCDALQGSHEPEVQIEQRGV